MDPRLNPRLAGRLEAVPFSGCWVYVGELNRNGYGRVWLGGERRMAHIAAYEAVAGPVPEGLVLDHLCRVRCCCRPDHLEPVTVRENTLRGEARLFTKLGVRE